MSNGQITTASHFLQKVIDALAAFGIVYESGKRYRLKALYDTQDVATASGTITEFFATATSNRTDHANKVEGCNLRESGKVDDDFLVLSMYAEYVTRNGGLAAPANDVAIVNDFGMVEKVWVNDQVKDEERFIRQLAANRGITFALIGLPSAALDFDSVSNGQPGIPSIGFELPPYSRFWIERGQTLKCEVTQRSGGALAAVVKLHLGLFGIECRSGS